MSGLKKIEKLTNTLIKVEDNLKQEKEILKFLIELSSDGYWDWHILKNYEYLSPQLKAQLGYEDSELKNSPETWKSLCHEEDIVNAEKELTDHLNGKTEEFSKVIRFKHKNGKYIQTLTKGKVIQRDSEGKAIRMVGIHIII